MAGRAPQRPRSVSSLTVASVDDEATQRALDQITAAVAKLQAKRDRDARTVDLAIGTNRVPHGLARPVLGYTITPTVASAAFAHAIDMTNPRPQLEVWITVVGADQPGARIEVY